MSKKIDIEHGRYWDEPWSLIDGCTPCSPGCDHCWSAAMTKRFESKNEWGDGALVSASGRFNGHIVFHKDRLSIPMERRPPTVFAVWNDLYHVAVPDKFIANAYQVINGNPRHTFLILTKRPERMRDFILRCGPWSGYVTHNGHAPQGFGGDGFIVGQEKEKLTDEHRYEGKERKSYWPPPNCWHGLTVCNQEEADSKIPIFLQVPGKKFLSIEPMLGAVNLTRVHYKTVPGGNEAYLNVLTGKAAVPFSTIPCGKVDAVILGGETGPGARPMHPDWVRSVRDQCAESGVSFFFKGWGAWKGAAYFDKAGNMVPGSHMTSRTLDGRMHDDLPWVIR